MMQIEKEHKQSALMSRKKEDLVRHIMVLEHNNNILHDTINQQAENFKKLLAEEVDYWKREAIKNAAELGEIKIRQAKLGLTEENMADYKLFEDECVAKGFSFNSLLDAREKQTPIKPLKSNKHVWIKNEYGVIDEFAFNQGYHNGPMCKICGDYFCMHCSPDYMEKMCDETHCECPICGDYVENKQEYCKKCGQAINWED